jgi:hypothetical protein
MTTFNVGGTIQIEANITDGRVKATPGQSLKVDVEGFLYNIGGLRGSFDGAVAQSVTDDDTNYVYFDDTPGLQINTTGYPDNGPFIALAKVVAANGEISSIVQEKVLLGSSSASIGTCIITLPVDGDVRGGDTSASSNNDWAAVKYEDTGTGEGRNRLVRRTPRNYIDGDLVVRVVASLASSVGSSPTRKARWEVQYKFASIGESLGSLSTVGVSETLNDQSADELFSIDLTIPEANVDMSKDYMALQINRDNDHADDNLGQDIYVHNIEIRYNGYRVAGQAGQ